MMLLFQNTLFDQGQTSVRHFELVFKRYFVRLCGYANLYTNDLEESREVVQEVFLKVWEKRHELPLGEELKGYLFRSVKNACINRLQHQMVENKYQAVMFFLSEQSAQSGVYEALELQELKEQIQKGLESLPESCRRIFLMSRDRGMKYREIALELNISVKTVETQMSRALSRLREKLSDYLD